MRNELDTTDCRQIAADLCPQEHCRRVCALQPRPLRAITNGTAMKLDSGPIPIIEPRPNSTT